MVLLGKPADFLGTVWGLDSWAGKCETGRRGGGSGREEGMRSEERRRKKGGERMKRCLREEKGVREREAEGTQPLAPQGGKEGRDLGPLGPPASLGGFGLTWRG